MQFLYHPEAGNPRLTVEGESYRYLFKVRRFRREDPLPLRNLRDEMLYTYRVEALDRRRASLVLENGEVLPVLPRRFLHLGWCIVDPKTIEKSLPTLNEIGVGKITFISCERSQRNFIPDFDRLHRILVNSSQQCGRSALMELERSEDLAAFLSKYPEALLLDFSSRSLACDGTVETLVIGCEGGISEEERRLFPPERVVGLETPLVLRSESAACSAAARLLL
jgi:16S rRNA (uracil1498-N3)-methyltransferase